MKAFIGAKIIQAEEMDEITFLKNHRDTPEDLSNRETQPGYHVIYPDNYHSWSPKAVFEEAYRPVNAAEAAFCIYDPKKDAPERGFKPIHRRP